MRATGIMPCSWRARIILIKVRSNAFRSASDSSSAAAAKKSVRAAPPLGRQGQHGGSRVRLGFPLPDQAAPFEHAKHFGHGRQGNREFFGQCRWRGDLRLAQVKDRQRMGLQGGQTPLTGLFPRATPNRPARFCAGRRRRASRRTLSWSPADSCPSDFWERTCAPMPRQIASLLRADRAGVKRF